MSTYQQTVKKTEKTISVFKGLDARERIDDGRWADMENLTADRYPAAGTRDKRTRMLFRGADGRIHKPMVTGMPTAARPTGTGFVFASDAGRLTDGEHSVQLEGEARQLLPFGRDWFVSPALALADHDLGSVRYTGAAYKGGISFTAVNDEGEELEIADTEPETPENGDYWFDSENNGLYRYSSSSGEWVGMTSTKIRITAVNLTALQVETAAAAIAFMDFKEGDAVRISGTNNENLDMSFIVQAATADSLTVEGMPLHTENETLNKAVIERRAPKADFACVHKNRVILCRYGENDDGDFVNEVYVSALGDPTNFFRYEGTAADSWTASVGDTGAWTGMAALDDRVLLFKEDCIYILTGTKPSSFSLSRLSAAGIEAGSEGSAVVIRGYCYYKSQFGVMRMSTSSLPRCVSNDLGPDRWTKATAATDGRRYYCAMENLQGEKALYFYDTLYGTWCKEDLPADFKFFVRFRNNLMAVSAVMTDTVLLSRLAFDRAAAEADKPGGGLQNAAALVQWELKVLFAMSIAAARPDILRRNAALALDKDTVTQEEAEAWALTEDYVTTTPIYGAEIDAAYVSPDLPIRPALPVVGADGAALAAETLADPVEKWSGTTGLLGLDRLNRQRVTEVRARVMLGRDSSFHMGISYDGEDRVQELAGETEAGFRIVRALLTPPVNCECFRLHVWGKGDCVIYSITHITEDGGTSVF